MNIRESVCVFDYCRFKELRQWLELYELDPNLKLHPPRAQQLESQRTFASSNYKLLVLEVKAKREKLSTFTILRAVEELIKMYAPKNWGHSFMQELNQSKKHGSFADDVGVTAQYLCKSSSRAKL